ncbi:MAG TPA: hypothetical protein VIS05_12935 [Ilumatobacter sp.]
MRTRTLLMLALACGLAIMLAGAVLLFQLAGRGDVAAPVALGVPATVGDMTVVVDAATESGGVLDVTVRIGGVDDTDGAGGFRLIASGRPVLALPGDTADACTATSLAPRTCHVRFDTSTADGSSRVLFYERGDAQARWVIE